MSFWRYGIVKTARKAVWLPWARFKAARKPPARHGMSAYGVRLWQRWDDRTFVYCHAGIYGRFLSGEIDRQTAPFAFVDVGANQGLYSLIAARNPQCRQVIAFEPVAATYAALVDNLAINAGTDTVTALQLGISATADEVEITIPAGHSGMASLRGAAPAGSTIETIRTVSAKELDDLLAGTLPLVIKVDVEGHEITVIEQLLSCAHAGRIACLFYEIDTRWSDAATIEQMVRAAGFTAIHQVGRGHHFDVMATRPHAVRGPLRSD
jgi:FkbM family methyltransferase